VRKMKYEEMLKRAYERLPKEVEERKRFEIPSVITEIQGNKTLLKNFSEITSVLRRAPKHLSKFLLKELATPGNIQGSFLILQRKVSRDMIQKKIQDYAKEFVYCKECKKPDTKLIKEERIYSLKCEACGAKYPVRRI